MCVGFRYDNGCMQLHLWKVHTKSMHWSRHRGTTTWLVIRAGSLVMALLVTDAACSFAFLRWWRSFIIFTIIMIWSTTSAGTRLWLGRPWTDGVPILLWAEWPYLLIQIPLAFASQPTRCKNRRQLVPVWSPGLLDDCDLHFIRFTGLSEKDMVKMRTS